MERVFIHPTAEVASDARIGAGTHIWHLVQVRSGAQIGTECNIGKNVYIDVSVVIGDRVKIQNNVSVYHGVTVEDGVFIGPHVCFTNDVLPRAITPQGMVKGQDDWVVTPTRVCSGALSIKRPVISILRWWRPPLRRAQRPFCRCISMATLRASAGMCARVGGGSIMSSKARAQR